MFSHASLGLIVRWLQELLFGRLTDSKIDRIKTKGRQRINTIWINMINARNYEPKRLTKRQTLTTQPGSDTKGKARLNYVFNHIKL